MGFAVGPEAIQQAEDVGPQAAHRVDIDRAGIPAGGDQRLEDERRAFALPDGTGTREVERRQSGGHRIVLRQVLGRRAEPHEELGGHRAGSGARVDRERHRPVADQLAVRNLDAPRLEQPAEAAGR